MSQQSTGLVHVCVGASCAHVFCLDASQHTGIEATALIDGFVLSI
jgi:hypothetical protein